MTRIIRHLAGPGSGKTTRLLQFLREEKENNGLKLQDIFFTSFSRTQINDVMNRASEIYPFATQNQLKYYIKTFHGLCWLSVRQDGLIVPKLKNGSGRDEIIQEAGQGKKHFSSFARSMGLPYAEYIGDVLDEDCDVVFVPGSVPLGNLFFAISRYMVSIMLPPEQWAKAVAKLRISVDKRRLNSDLFRKWDKYKRDRNLWEHDDYVKYTLDTQSLVSPKILLIDEFQDLSPLQYAVVSMWIDSGLIETVFVAGDPNQSIYSFRGCNPAYLINLMASNTWTGQDKPISHRCPPEIVDAADRVLQTTSYIKPKSDCGSVVWFDDDGKYVKEQFDSLIDNIVELERLYTSVMVLTRFKTHAKRVSDELTVRGIPHHGLSDRRFTLWKSIKNDEWDPVDVPSLIGFLKSLNNYRANVPLSSTLVKHVREMAKLITRKDIDTADHPLYKLIRYKSDLELIPVEGVINTFPFPDRITSKYLLGAFRVPPKYRLILVGIAKFLESGRKLSPNSIVLDTVHQSKGSEADAVVLFGAYLKGRVDDLKFDPGRWEEEKRVFYVGITRARRHLTIVGSPLLGGICAPVLDPINPEVAHVR